MAFNGSGTFLRVMNWVNDATAGIKVRADRHDQEDDNLAAGLSNCITRDGQTQITADIPFANRRITALGDPTADQDGATKKYVDTLTNFAVQLDIKGSGQLGHVRWTGNDIDSPATNWGTLGLQFNEADLFVGVKTAGGSRMVVNDKADGTGAEVFSVTKAAAATLRGASCQYRIAPTTGNGHVWFMAADGTTTRAVIYTDSGAQGPLIFAVGGSSYSMGPSGDLVSSGRVMAGNGAAFVNTDGNVTGTVWNSWGASDAYSAILARIEARAQAWANDRVAQLQYRRVTQTYSGNIPVFTCPAGAVLSGYSREGGTTGQLGGCYYVYLQAYDPVRGWVGWSA